MAKGASKDSGSAKGFNKAKMAKTQDIITGARTVVEHTSFEGGYPTTMEHHINRKGGSKKGYAD